MCYNMEAPQGYYTKLNKPDAERQTLTVSTYMRHLEQPHSERQRAEWW
jgi:hypothetical protein